MILSSKNNNFIVNLPKNFLYPIINEKYNKFVKRLSSPYETAIDYLNSSIQAINFPATDTETIEQYLLADKTSWKSGFNMKPLKEFSLTFKNYEGYLNYWMMFEQFKEFLSYDNEHEFFPNIRIIFLDQVGHEFITLDYGDIIMTGISGLDLDYSSNTPEFQTFSCDFSFNKFKIK